MSEDGSCTVNGCHECVVGKPSPCAVTIRHRAFIREAPSPVQRHGNERVIKYFLRRMEKWGLRFGKVVYKVKPKDRIKTWRVLTGDIVSKGCPDGVF